MTFVDRTARVVVILVIGLLLFAAVPVAAAVPGLINFQGILRDASGNPIADGSYSVTFRIYDAASAGTENEG